MTSSPPDAGAAALPVVGLGPRLVLAAVVSALFAGLGVLLSTDNQFVMIGVVVANLAVLGLADSTAIGRKWAEIAQARADFINWTALACALVLIGVLRADDYTLLMIATVTFFATACIGLNIQLALAGVVNFAGAAFFVAGGYTAAVLGSTSAVPSILILAASGFVACALGLCVLLPVMRARGHYAALVTIAFGLLVKTFLDVNDVLGGPQGLKVAGLTLFGLDFGSFTKIGPLDVSFYLPYALCGLALLVAALWLSRRIQNSWLGICLDAVRSDETAASVFGLSISYWKTFAFCAGNLLIGVAGGAYAMMSGFITPTGASLSESLMLLSIIVLGGLGNNWGTLGAAVVILVLPEKLQFIQEFRLLIFAVLVMLILRYRPAGILPRPLRRLMGHGVPGDEP